MLNGINRFGNQSSIWSTCSILVLNYNLSSWLTTKKLFLMHVLLIPKNKLVKNKNINLYMPLLLDELLELWKGVHSWDVTKPIGDRKFTMHVFLMWSIHDLPTYGLLVDQITKGFKGCPTCGPNTSSHHFRNLGKMVYEFHHRWLRPIKPPILIQHS